MQGLSKGERKKENNKSKMQNNENKQATIKVQAISRYI